MVQTASISASFGFGVFVGFTKTSNSLSNLSAFLTSLACGFVLKEIHPYGQ